MSEDPYVRVAQSVVRIVGSALIMAGVFLFSADLFLYLSHKPTGSIASFFSKGLLVMFGLWLVVKSRVIAERVTRDL